MAANVTEARNRVVEALGFWFVTLLICAIAGLASYKFGRDWIGDRIGGDVKPILTTQALVDRMGGGEAEPEPAANSPATGPAQPPPEKAVVEVTPTTPTTEDRQKLRVEGERGAADSGQPSSRRESSDEADTPRRSAEEERDPAPPRARRPEAKPRESEPAVPTKPEVTPSTGGEYTVRAGSYAERANADRMVAKLRAQGYQPFVTRIVKDGREYHRVNVATVPDRDEALKLRGELRSAGYDADVSGD
jgi:cell division septation protein DedD